MKKEYWMYLAIVVGTLVFANKLKSLPGVNKLPTL